MISAAEAVKCIHLTTLEESEVQRLGAEVVATVRGPAYDGAPLPLKIDYGKTEDEQKVARRIACALKRRFEAEGWAVTLDGEADAYGEPDKHVLWFAIDGAANRRVASASTDTALAETASPLRALAAELATLYGHATGSAVPPPIEPTLSVLLGTYNRIAHLKRAVASIRQSVGENSYEIVVTDGGSTDGTRAWLAAQPDVILIGERRMEGAVRAFNQAFALSRGRFIANLNDDMVVHGYTLAHAVEYLSSDQAEERGLAELRMCGQVAIPFRGGMQSAPQTNDAYPNVGESTKYANFGVVRRDVADAVARIQGGFWNPIYRTYAGDTEFSAWVWRLGFTVDELPGGLVEDAWCEDDLREHNYKHAAAETKRMHLRWPAEAFDPESGVDPHVSREEIHRLIAEERRLAGGSDGLLPGEVAHHVKQAGALIKRLTPQTVNHPADDVATFAEACGLPEPQEERRLRRLAPAIRALDPVPGRLPKRADKLAADRVLHVSLCTDADPQAGLVCALREMGSGGYEEVRWFADYGDNPDARRKAIMDAATRIQPTLVFLQLQMPNAVDVSTIDALRIIAAPSCVIATWNGDIANENSPWNVDWQVPLGRAVDLHLHSSMTHVRALRAAGVHNAGWLDIGYDEGQYHPPDARLALDFDVVFLGNRYVDGDPYTKTLRRHDAKLRDDVVLAMKRAFGARFGLFGRGWSTFLFENGIMHADVVVPLAKAHEMYWRSKIGLSISLANDLSCYSSDRLHRILGCGTLALVKRFPGMDVLGLEDAENCMVWETPEEAVNFVARASEDLVAALHSQIAANGAALARENHTWSARMRELQYYVDAVRSAR